MPRVAICIVGQFRDHIPMVYPALNKTLLHRGDMHLDIYIETWEDMATINVQWNTLYPNLKFLRVETPPKNLSSMHSVTVPYELRQRRPGWLANFWKMFECSEAIRKTEHDERLVYDAIIKMRPDSKFGSRRLKMAVLKDTVWNVSKRKTSFSTLVFSLIRGFKFRTCTQLELLRPCIST